MSRLPTCHIRHPFRSTLTEFGFAAVSTLVLTADNAKIGNLNVWLYLDPTFDLLKVARWVVPIAVLSASLRLLTRKLGRGWGVGAKCSSLPSQWKVNGTQTPRWWNFTEGVKLTSEEVQKCRFDLSNMSGRRLSFQHQQPVQLMEIKGKSNIANQGITVWKPLTVSKLLQWRK